METSSKKNWLSHILGGGFLTEDFIIKQSKLLILIVLLIMAFISNRYSCMKKLTEIEILKTKLQDVKYENMIISTEVTAHSRQSQIEELLKKKGIDLVPSKSAFYEIKK
jgi:cell division protein FtsL